MKNKNWFLFVDAREDDGLNHDEAVTLLRNKGVSDEEINLIVDKYDDWVKKSTWEVN